MRWRSRWRAADVAVSAVEGWQRHRTGSSASLIAYFGFVSVFPLLAVMVTVLGWVLEGDEQLRDDIVDSALSRLPIVGPQLQIDPARLTGSVPVLVVGLLIALWAGTRAFAQAQQAMDDVWEVPFDRRPNVAARRGRSLVAVAVVGVAQIASAAIVTVALAGVADVPVAGRALLTVGAFGVNLATLAVVYSVLTSPRLSWRTQILPGAVLAAVVFTVLQAVGTAVVGRAIARASSVYGTFASVIALVSWLALHATATLAGAELNAALDPLSGSRRDTGAGADEHTDGTDRPGTE